MNRSKLRVLLLIGTSVAALAAFMLFPKAKPASNPPNDDPWVLVNYDPDADYGTYLGNGLIATRIQGELGDGQSITRACYTAGLYDNERIIQSPGWSSIQFTSGTRGFYVDRRQDYVQKLDMRTGILTTQGVWRRERGATLRGSIKVIVSRAQPNVALIRSEFVPSFTGQLRVTIPVDNPDALRIVEAGPEPIPAGRHAATVATYVTSQSKTYVTLAQYMDSANKIPDKMVLRTMELRVRKDEPFTVDYYAATTLGRDGKSTAKAAIAELQAAVAQSEKFVTAHKAAMAELWEHDIVIDGPVKDQQALRACKFYLLQSVREGSQCSIAPMGLSGEGYQGHIFWDADVWMFPALILQHPELARSIVDYRYKTLEGALQNANADGFDGAQYAWESATTGREVTPEGLPYRHERHINGGVALAQWQYYLATGDLEWLKSRAYPILKETADWWVSKAKFVKENGRYEIHDVVPPDENAELVNNSAYTNAIAKLNLEIAAQAAGLVGKRPNARWTEIAEGMYIPYDPANKRFVARDNYDGVIAKQADTELLAFPLQVEFTGQDMSAIYRNTLEYYSARVHKNGPAMISSAYSVVAARVGDRERAYKDFVASYEPYFRQPFLLFNEKASRTVDNTCFLTGAAGPIKAVLFGLAGARMDYYPADPRQTELSFQPCLPREWRQVRITGVQWRGETYDVTIKDGDKVSVIRTQPRG